MMSRALIPVVRPASSADCPVMKEVLLDTFESTWRPNISPASAQAYLDTDRGGAYVDQYGRNFWVAEVDGDLAGLVHWQDDFIHALHVRSGYTRRGVGRHLLDLAERKIAESGYLRVRLETDTFNQASRAFYAAQGYSEVDRYPDKEWNSDLMTILLVKQLRRS